MVNGMMVTMRKVQRTVGSSSREIDDLMETGIARGESLLAMLEFDTLHVKSSTSDLLAWRLGEEEMVAQEDGTFTQLGHEGM